MTIPASPQDPILAPTRDRVTGVVLAGGLSSRMGRPSIASPSNPGAPSSISRAPSSQRPSLPQLEAPSGIQPPLTPLEAASGMQPSLPQSEASQSTTTDKGLLNFRGRPLAARVLERLRPQVGPVLINANRHLEAWSQFGETLVSDRRTGFAGPLAGLEAALQAVQTPWVLTVPCDGPAFPLDLAARLGEAALQHAAQVASARTATQAHPVYMLVHESALPSLTAFLDSGRRRIDAWMATLPHIEVVFQDESAFANLNTPEEFAAAQANLGPGESSQ